MSSVVLKFVDRGSNLGETLVQPAHSRFHPFHLRRPPRRLRPSPNGGNPVPPGAPRVQYTFDASTASDNMRAFRRLSGLTTHRDHRSSSDSCERLRAGVCDTVP